MAADPELSVVIPSYNRRESLFRTLSALSEQSLEAERFEVIVVLDGSCDGSREALDLLATPFRLRVHSQPRGGPSTARNAGAAMAEGEVLLFLDDDILLEQGALVAHLHEQSTIGGGCVLGDLENRPEHGGLPALAARGWPAAALRQRPPRWSDLYAGNVSLPRALFDRVGGFEESLTKMEDLELGQRLAEAGAPLAFSVQARGVHYYGKSALDYVRDREDIGVMTVRLFRDHRSLAESITPRRAGRSGWLLPALLRGLAVFPMPARLAGLAGRIPLRTPGARALFEGMGHHAYLRGVRREARGWTEWREFLNRPGTRKD